MSLKEQKYWLHLDLCGIFSILKAAVVVFVKFFKLEAYLQKIFVKADLQFKKGDNRMKDFSLNFSLRLLCTSVFFVGIFIVTPIVAENYAEGYQGSFPLHPDSCKYVLPSEYLPVYPGSWWRYNMNIVFRDSTTQYSEKIWNVKPRYQFYSLSNVGADCESGPQFSFVPVLNDQPIYGTAMILNWMSGCGIATSFIETEEMKIWAFPIETGGRCAGEMYQCSDRMVVSNDTSLIISGVLMDSLLHIKQSSVNNDSNTVVNEFYKKGIGLVYKTFTRGTTGIIKDIFEVNIPDIVLSTEMILQEYRISEDKRLDQLIVPISLNKNESGYYYNERWGNVCTFFSVQYGCPDNYSIPMNIQNSIDKTDTLLLMPYSTSGLAVDIVINSKAPAKVDNGTIIMDNGMYIMHVEMHQDGNSEFRTAPVFEGDICVEPSDIVVKYDTIGGKLKVEGFPDSIIYWTWSEDDTSQGDSVGAGTAIIPSKPGYYSAHAATKDTAICKWFRNYPDDRMSSAPFNWGIVAVVSSSVSPGTTIVVKLFNTIIPVSIPITDINSIQVQLFDIKGRVYSGLKIYKTAKFMEISTSSYHGSSGMYFLIFKKGLYSKTIIMSVVN